MVVRKMPYKEFVVYLEEKCGCYFQGLYYQVPCQDLKRGLVRVSDDRSLSYMFDVEETFGRLNLYLDHLDIDLSEYLSQDITYDMDVCVSKTIGPPKKSTRNIDKGIDTTDGVEARTSTTNKGKEKVSKYATEVVQTRRSTIEINTETMDDSDDDSDYESDKSVDYLSLGEEELIQLRNMINRESKAKAKDNPLLKVLTLLIRVESLKILSFCWKTCGEVGEKYVCVAQFKECLTYYALANGFSLWYERSREVRVVAKCYARIDQGVGSTSGIRACALRNFDLGKMELENSQNNALAKLPMLKLGEYEMWEIRIKQYFQIQDYALWEVIENGNSWVPIPVTTPESDTPPEDLNVKFLRSLPSEWDTHVVVWMNKPNFETMGLDDLYKNFKIVEQKVKRTVAANNDDKNLAFLTTSSPSSTNTINIVNIGVSTANTKVNTASTETSTASFSDATVYAFLSTQPQGSQLVHEDLEQLALMGYHTDSDKLTFQKGAFSPQWRFLIHNILHCLSPKKTVWEQFSSNIATALAVQFFCAPEMEAKANMKRPTKGFSGQEVALFPTMLDDPEPSTSPSRITSSPSPSPTQPSPTQPSPTQPSPTQPSPTQPSSTQTGTA
ncbi:hypothetical protein Tco_0783426 [Tanacetum coccineum]